MSAEQAAPAVDDAEVERIATVVHDVIEALPHERRLYPDLYATDVAREVLAAQAPAPTTATATALPVPEPEWMQARCHCQSAVGPEFPPEPGDAWGCPQHGAEADAWRAGRNAALAAAGLLGAQTPALTTDARQQALREARERLLAEEWTDERADGLGHAVDVLDTMGALSKRAPTPTGPDLEVRPDAPSVPTTDAATVLARMHREHRVGCIGPEPGRYMVSRCACGIEPTDEADLASHIGQVSTAALAAAGCLR